MLLLLTLVGLCLSETDGPIRRLRRRLEEEDASNNSTNVTAVEPNKTTVDETPNNSTMPTSAGVEASEISTNSSGTTNGSEVSSNISEVSSNISEVSSNQTNPEFGPETQSPPVVSPTTTLFTFPRPPGLRPTEKEDFVITVLSRSADNFRIMLESQGNYDDSVDCVLKHATEGVISIAFAGKGVRHIVLKPSTPIADRIIHFAETSPVGGFPRGTPLSPGSQYRISCVGSKSSLLKTQVIIAQARSGHAHEFKDEDSYVYGSTSRYFRYFIITVGGCIIVLCCTKYWRRREVHVIDYELPRTSARSSGYVPPDMVGFSGDI